MLLKDKMKERMTDQNLKRILVIPERAARSFNACGWIRLVHPYLELHSSDVFDVRIGNLGDISKWLPHIIVSQRCALNFSELDIVEKSKQKGIKFIFDLDDDLLNIPDNHSDFHHLKTRQDGILRAMRMADVVTVSTKELAQSFLQGNHISRDKITVIHSELHRSWVDESSDRVAQSLSNPIIVYMGSPSHIQDWLLVQDQIREWLTSRDDFEMQIMGIPEQYVQPHDKISNTLVPFAARESYPAFTHWYKSQRNFKIGIHPLEMNSINASKSAIKVLQYASQGTVSIVGANSEISELRETFDFGFVMHSGETWQDSLDLAAVRSVATQDSDSLVRTIRDKYVLAPGKGATLVLQEEIRNHLD